MQEKKNATPRQTDFRSGSEACGEPELGAAQVDFDVAPADFLFGCEIAPAALDRPGRVELVADSLEGLPAGIRADPKPSDVGKCRGEPRIGKVVAPAKTERCVCPIAAPVGPDALKGRALLLKIEVERKMAPAAEKIDRAPVRLEGAIGGIDGDRAFFGDTVDR